LFRALDGVHLSGLALLIILLALVASLLQWQTRKPLPWDPDWNALWERWQAGAFRRGDNLFAGMLVYDNFAIYLRLFLTGFTTLVVWLSILTGIPDREDSADFYTLLLGATLGMSIMASANHLLMVFIGVEMASLPSYALAGFLKGKRQS